MSKVKIVDENGQVVPVNTRGELWTRGYSTMLKYWNDDEKTAQTITAERWLKTG
jgi:long-subunit acyl-CoA synthetase (AMP-forming)